MKNILSSAGDRDLQRILLRHPVLAFDYDGTLAPITPRPEQTVTPAAILSVLRELSRRHTVLILSGRAASDVRQRLDLPTATIIGNHGAESLQGPGSALHRQTIQAWDSMIRQEFSAELAHSGLLLENKGYSLSLHYRLAHDKKQAHDLLRRVRARLPTEARSFPGKQVLNIAPPGAPDKALALAHFTMPLDRSQPPASAIYIGDDYNDESVFELAPPDWLTIKVGSPRRTAARYYARQQCDVLPLLLRIAGHLGVRALGKASGPA